MDYFLGIDIGGTNLKAVSLAPDGQQLQSWQVPTGDDGTEAWQENAANLIATIQQECGGPPLGAGFAAPGLPRLHEPIMETLPGRLRGIGSLDWRKFFPEKTPVILMNDARAALWGEIDRGAATGLKNVVMLTLGTGVGGAVMVDGQMLHGHRNRAGHLGHISLNPYGLPDCVQTPGSLEDFMGASGLFRQSGGKYRTHWQMQEPLKAGDAFTWALWQRNIDHLAAAIVSLINVFDPEVVILGGGTATYTEMLFPPLKKAVRRMEWQINGEAVPIVPAQLRSHAGAVGSVVPLLEKHTRHRRTE